MAILGQLECAATTNEVLDPGDFNRIVEHINIANNTAGALTFRVYVVKQDETLAAKHQYAYGETVAANARATITDDLRLKLGDKIWIWASATGIVASAYGQQIA